MKNSIPLILLGLVLISIKAKPIYSKNCVYIGLNGYFDLTSTNDMGDNGFEVAKEYFFRFCSPVKMSNCPETNSRVLHYNNSTSICENVISYDIEPVLSDGSNFLKKI